ncbi:hypothetical protein [Nonomuraea sp. 10N515B]|uniref:hypothetical protein n=1 Tax=Nonomuraea sp. 10N515B TaxID=3457422 RepID=UPI003FCDFA1F
MIWPPQTIEIRVSFMSGRDNALPRVRRVARYGSFEATFDSEGPANADQLTLNTLT